MPRESNYDNGDMHLTIEDVFRYPDPKDGTGRGPVKLGHLTAVVIEENRNINISIGVDTPHDEFLEGRIWAMLEPDQWESLKAFIDSRLATIK
jgi:hypothetical protein